MVREEISQAFCVEFGPGDFFSIHEKASGCLVWNGNLRPDSNDDRDVLEQYEDELMKFLADGLNAAEKYNLRNGHTEVIPPHRHEKAVVWAADHGLGTLIT